MSGFRNVTLGEHIFSQIDANPYLQKIYRGILFNYSRRIFSFYELPEEKINITDALAFADLLSKSCGTNLTDIHRTRAQEMASLLYGIYPENAMIRYFFSNILSSTGNFLAMKRTTPNFESASFWDNLFMHYNKEYLTIPTDRENIFFPSQKRVYNRLSLPYFSFSTPTSMGKTFMMR
ncbi:MAG: helicase, partial [Schwartzia sp.]|nr:helicase [Schwartzia sp. (in: firmicutes)]